MEIVEYAWRVRFARRPRPLNEWSRLSL
jgi:hypothetical protein